MIHAFARREPEVPARRPSIESADSAEMRDIIFAVASSDGVALVCAQASNGIANASRADIARVDQRREQFMCSMTENGTARLNQLLLEPHASLPADAGAHDERIRRGRDTGNLQRGHAAAEHYTGPDTS